MAAAFNMSLRRCSKTVPSFQTHLNLLRAMVDEEEVLFDSPLDPLRSESFLGALWRPEDSLEEARELVEF